MTIPLVKMNKIKVTWKMKLKHPKLKQKIQNLNFYFKYLREYEYYKKTYHKGT